MNRTGPVDFERERNLPQFGLTTIAMRMSLLIPMIAAFSAALSSHAFFAGLHQWHPSSYSLASHVGFFVVFPAPVIGLLVMRTELETKHQVGLLLTFAYLALGHLASQAAGAVLP